MQVLYLAHDLDDSAIWRRVAMLRTGGAQVRVAGFRRGQTALPEPVIVLGQTRNQQMAQRAMAVAKAVPRLRYLLAGGPAPDVILARNLEMLVLGVALQRIYPEARLVYELLDIHRLLLGAGVVSGVLRRIEAGLMTRSSGVIISSPGFRRQYLTPFARPVAALLLVENKPLMAGPETAQNRKDGTGRITLGWFGILRCGWSLSMLDALTRANPGRIRVILRGKPALDQIPAFHATVAANPDLAFEGPYRAPDDLAAIYADVDLAWLIDRYEAGANSDWLLPNRLYEGCLHGAVPLTLAGTEVGRLVADRGIGLVASAPDLASLSALLTAGQDAAIAQAAARLAAMPNSVWRASPAECRQLVAWMEGLGPAAVRRGPCVVPKEQVLE